MLHHVPINEILSIDKRTFSLDTEHFNVEFFSKQSEKFSKNFKKAKQSESIDILSF